MSAVADKLVGTRPKEPYFHIFVKMNPADRKYIRYWKAYFDGNYTKVLFYIALIGQGLLEHLVEFTELHKGEIRIYPDNSLVCFEMTFLTKR